MPSFTSSLYLGLTHPHRELPAWSRLTTGTPAVLGELPAAARVARAAADLLGLDDALVCRSTLHASWDVVDELCRTENIAFVMDDGAYEISRWALEHASARGVPVVQTPHHDLGALERRLVGGLHGRRPVVVCDGMCPGCGPTPLTDVVAIVGAHDGYVVVDDTQAIGVLGRAPRADAPFGIGGGGTLQWTGADSARAIVVASFAKGLGAPLAVTAGPSSFIGRIRANGPTRVHASGPSAADLAAAESALAVNRGPAGERARTWLARLVDRLRAGLARLGVLVRRDWFPVQPAGPFPLAVATAVHRDLARRGVHTAVQRPRCGDGALVTFVVTAAHRFEDIDHALRALRAALPEVRRAS
jgi:8-amino-7-oxononanoate synthase